MLLKIASFDILRWAWPQMQQTHERFPCFHKWVKLETRNMGQCRMMQNKKGIFLERERERTDPLSECHSSETAKLQLTLLQKSTCVKIKKQDGKNVGTESQLRESCIGERKHHTRHKAATSCFPKLVKVETGSIGNDIKRKQRTRKKYKNTWEKWSPCWKNGTWWAKL